MPLRCLRWRRRPSHKIVPALTIPPSIQDDIERLIDEHTKFYYIHLNTNITYTITPEYIHMITERKARLNGLLNSGIDLLGESCILMYQGRFNYFDIKIYNTMYKLFKDGRIRFTKDAMKIPYVREHILTNSNERSSSIYTDRT